METKRKDFVSKVNELLRITDVNDVTLKYGYVDYNKANEYGIKGVFIECDYDINTDPDKREMVLAKYDSQSDVFGSTISIEGDGLFWVLMDIVKGVNKL